MYASMPKTSGTNSLIDLRSDTVTRPSPGMVKAIATAEVGDDVYGDDPTVNSLEERTADLLGKAAGLFVSSGTQSNLLALMSHCGRGDEYIGGTGYHISNYEAGGAAVLGSISPKHLALNENGGLNAADVEAAIQPDDSHFAITKLVCIENTFGGKVVNQSEIEKVAKTAHDHGLNIHLDGARLMNAAVKSGKSAGELVANMDSVSLCLSKGLGAPVGSVLCGSKGFITHARRTRKMLGGGMRQAGVLAACGHFALENNIERLEEDHQNAITMAERLLNIDGLDFDLQNVQTNMIWLNVKGKGKESLSQHMMQRGMVISDPDGADNTVRLVTHLDFEASQIDQVVDGFATWLGK